jgi:hypothetical protein
MPGLLDNAKKVVIAGRRQPSCLATIFITVFFGRWVAGEAGWRAAIAAAARFLAL